MALAFVHTTGYVYALNSRLGKIGYLNDNYVRLYAHHC